MGRNAEEFRRMREFEQSDDFIDVSTEPITAVQEGSIDSLLNTSNISHEEREDIARSVPAMTAEEARNTIRYLLENQLNLITSGFRYSQSDIVKINNKNI